MSIDMFLILIPFIIIVILFIITVGTFKSPICGYKKESDLVERLLKSLAVIVLPMKK